MQEKPVRPIVNGGSPKRAKIPFHRAQRWMADGENGRAPAFCVFVTQTAFKAINNHANTDLDNEVGGWLAGRWCRDIDTKAEFVVVEALLPAQQVRAGSTFLTFTHDSQVAMLAAMEERYANKGIVGWYHTHPRMGIFLSGYDTWLHSHFFPHPWQVALVVEPHNHLGGFFIRNKKLELDARRYYGFYELHNRKHESIVDWQNLHLEKKLEKPEPALNLSNRKPEGEAKGEPNKAKLAIAVRKKEAQQDAKPSLTSSMSSDAKPELGKPAKQQAEVEKRAGGKEKTLAPVIKPRSVEDGGTASVKTTELANHTESARLSGPGEAAEPAKSASSHVLRKFEGPPPPAKFSLIKKEDKKKSESETNPSEEAKS